MILLIASLFASIIVTTMPDHFGPVGDQNQGPIFSFGVIADVQYCNCEPGGSRFYRGSLSKLRNAISSLKESQPEFLVNLGDLIDRDYTSFKPVLDIIDSSGIKTYHCFGNHDFSVENRYKKKLPLPMPAREGYYSFAKEGFRFIFLNGNDFSTYATASKSSVKKAEEFIAALKSEGSINAVNWNGGISTTQLSWLKKQLDEATVNKENVFIMCHFPVFPENVHNLLNYKEVNKLLEQYQNIIAWFSGHNHAGNYGNFNMIHFVTLKGMVETESTGSFALVEVYNNKIWIKGSGRERGQILAY